jgi:hypothetical protein
VPGKPLISGSCGQLVDKLVAKKSDLLVRFLFANRVGFDDNCSWKFCGTSGQRTQPNVEAQQGTAAPRPGAINPIVLSLRGVEPGPRCPRPGHSLAGYKRCRGHLNSSGNCAGRALTGVPIYRNRSKDRARGATVCRVEDTSGAVDREELSRATFETAALQGTPRFTAWRARHVSFPQSAWALGLGLQGRTQLGGPFGGCLSFRWVVCSRFFQVGHTLASDNRCPRFAQVGENLWGR